MKTAHALEHRRFDLGLVQLHIGAGVAIKTQILATIVPNGHEHGRGAGLVVDQQVARIDPGLVQALTQINPERIIAHLADESRGQPQALQGHRHIGGCPTRRLDETGRSGQ